MANRVRGEASATVGGKEYALAMTVGAMAELADALDVQTIEEFNGRLAKLKLGDVGKIIAALFKGNGHDVPAEAIAKLPFDAGMDIITRVMTAGASDEKAARPPKAARPAA